MNESTKSAASSFCEAYAEHCLERQATGKYRQLPAPVGFGFADFSSNNYLGLAQCPVVLAAAMQAGQQLGTGATGSRLFSGNFPLIMELEENIAAGKGTETALVFPSGFQANSATLASLLDPAVNGRPALVFFDRLNHASLYQGVFSGKARILRYRHACMNHLEALLRKYQNHPAPKFIVSETLFGMDGDIVPLADLLALARRFGTFVYLDEAHATGMLGKGGYGLSTNFDLTDVPHVLMGTFSKALGGSGGYIACTTGLRAYLLNHATGFIYTTALSPLMAGAALAAWQASARLSAARLELFSRAAHLRAQLQSKGLNTGLSETHILPVLLENEKMVLARQQSLFQQKMLVSAVRPPTVPPGTSRLRIALCTFHTESAITQLTEALTA